MSVNSENPEDRYKQLRFTLPGRSLGERFLPLSPDEKRIQLAFERDIEAKYLGVRDVFDRFLLKGAPPDIYKELTEDLVEFPVHAAVLAPATYEYEGKPYISYDRISESGNMTNWHKQSNEHAEVLALRKAAEKVGDKHLPKGYVLVSTIEPCASCAKIAVDYNCDTVIFGVHHDKLRGKGENIWGTLKPWRVEPPGYSAEEFIKARNPEITVIGGYRENDVLDFIYAIPVDTD